MLGMGKGERGGGRNENGYGIGWKGDGEDERGKGIMVVDNKRRGRDIGKEEWVRKRKVKDIR